MMPNSQARTTMGVTVSRGWVVSTVPHPGDRQLSETPEQESTRGTPGRMRSAPMLPSRVSDERVTHATGNPIVGAVPRKPRRRGSNPWSIFEPRLQGLQRIPNHGLAEQSIMRRRGLAQAAAHAGITYRALQGKYQHHRPYSDLVLQVRRATASSSRRACLRGQGQTDRTCPPRCSLPFVTRRTARSWSRAPRRRRAGGLHRDDGATRPNPRGTCAMTRSWALSGTTMDGAAGRVAARNRPQDRRRRDACTGASASRCPTGRTSHAELLARDRLDQHTEPRRHGGNMDCRHGPGSITYCGAHRRRAAVLGDAPAARATARSAGPREYPARRRSRSTHQGWTLDWPRLEPSSA